MKTMMTTIVAGLMALATFAKMPSPPPPEFEGGWECRRSEMRDECQRGRCGFEGRRQRGRRGFEGRRQWGRRGFEGRRQWGRRGFRRQRGVCPCCGARFDGFGRRNFRNFEFKPQRPQFKGRCPQFEGRCPQFEGRCKFKDGKPETLKCKKGKCKKFEGRCPKSEGGEKGGKCKKKFRGDRPENRD